MDSPSNPDMACHIKGELPPSSASPSCSCAAHSDAVPRTCRTATCHSGPSSVSPAFASPMMLSPKWKRAICRKCNGKGHIARACPSAFSDAPLPAHIDTIKVVDADSVIAC
ncbi:hypothetical protein K438DRAFT_1836465 [Mycena galopus ATCC 62051]|nr:hypothetical protein K438DRAFT_1842469 [Mycena galopus ATCC 62051]KAF8185887.1 hypothetical protein K438DRAFT_1836465 [Mycena galopus ATCC 62051]